MPSIEIAGVNHHYGEGETKKQVLFDNRLTIWPGEIVIMTGPSGSGKTTLLTLIGGLRSVQEGSLRVLGRELKGLSQSGLERVRHGIGFIFQAHNLFESLTAYQTLQLAMQLHPYPPDEFRRRPLAVLEDLGLAHRAHYKPEKLSGGQRQRVAIGRALINRPKLILADEPTAALDRESGRKVVTLLQQLAREEQATILIDTHDSRILDVANRVVNMVDGQIVSDVDVQESLVIADILKNCAVFKAATPQLIATVAGEMKRETAMPGATIIREGERGEKFYLVRSGRVRVTKRSADGTEKELVVLGPGGFFGELALINDAPRAATVTAVEPAELLVLGKERFLEVVNAGADVAEQLRRAYFGR